MPYSLRFAVTTSPATLPTVCVVGSLVWLCGGIGEGHRWLAWMVTLATTFAIMTWNSRATLIRQRTRMASTTFFVLLSCFAFLEDWDKSMWAALCYVIAHILFSSCYQDNKSQGIVYHVFLCFGIGSLFFRPLLLLIPFFLLSLSVQLRALTWRSAVAAVLGVLTPYWLIVGWNVWQGAPFSENLWQAGDITFGFFGWQALDAARRVCLCVLTGYIAVAMLFYLRDSYQDKIRTRMFIYTIMVQILGIGLMMLFLPGHFNGTIRLMCCAAAPLIGHHLTLVRGRYVNWYFIGTLSLMLFLAVFTRL